MTTPDPGTPLETLVIPGSSLGVAERGELGAGATAVVVQLGTESSPAGPAAVEVLDWLRSPARLSIAAVRGACGPHEAQLALACDLVVMSRTATITLTSRDLPAAGVLERLVARVGASSALMLALRPSPLAADEARGSRLVDAVVDDDELDALVRGLVDALASRPAGWIGELKTLLAAAEGPSHEAEGRHRLRRWESDAAQRLAGLDHEND